MIKESQIEQELIEQLVRLKYVYRPDIVDSVPGTKLQSQI